ncbi:MAG: hypothetical protein NTW28_13460 [Candidatus Solibacter sp.]|nr:hypothetical protein [Candidatus Solibacter sp.]MCX6925710.1 hypothetical protein [Verrucomicrobiota bacterium]
MAVALVNSRKGNAASSLATNWSVTAGNILVAFFFSDNGTEPAIGCSDGTNSYTQFSRIGNYAAHHNVYACVLAAGGTITVTANDTWDTIVLAEFSGVTLTTDATTVKAGLSNQYTQTLAITVPSDGDLILSCWAVNSPAVTYYGSIGTDFQKEHNSSSHLYIANWATGAAGTFTQVFTLSPTWANANCSGCIIALKAAASGPAIPVFMNQYRQRRN